MSETPTIETSVKNEQFCDWIMGQFGSRVEVIERVVRLGDREIRTVVRFSKASAEDAA